MKFQSTFFSPPCRAGSAHLLWKDAGMLPLAYRKIIDSSERERCFDPDRLITSSPWNCMKTWLSLMISIKLVLYSFLLLSRKDCRKILLWFHEFQSIWLKISFESSLFLSFLIFIANKFSKIFEIHHETLSIESSLISPPTLFPSWQI